MKGESINIINEQIEKLKQLFPETISEGKIDWEKLQASLGKENIEFHNERYVLNWAGKSEAFKVLQQTTTATLKPVSDESVNFETTENVFIEGENLEVLKVLQKSYYGKIKCIIIDPPYNTGNDSFIYPERIIKAVSSSKKQNIIAHLFAFEDTKQARNNEGIMILNDLERDVASEVLQAIEEYGINDFSWKNREKWLEKLVA
jgi:16S rRNA G966 N2-methylase RsmD